MQTRHLSDRPDSEGVTQPGEYRQKKADISSDLINLVQNTEIKLVSTYNLVPKKNSQKGFIPG